MTPQDESKFVQALRSEAYELKDCFTRYSFQAMSIAVGALVAILRFQIDHPETGVASILPIVLLLSAGSMGTHKYAAVNRLLGYELHLQRTAMLRGNHRAYWKQAWRGVGWEEAMRAWRVVAPTLIDAVCNVPPKSRDGRRQSWFRPWRFAFWRLRPDAVRRRVAVPLTVTSDPAAAATSKPSIRIVEIPRTERWFEPPSLIPRQASYFAGGYLQTMLRGIYFVVLLAVVDLFATPFWIQAESKSGAKRAHLLIACVASGTAAIMFLFRALQLNARKRTLESGILSIHSCAIMWHAAIAAHFRALSGRGAASVTGFDGYTRRLGEEACAYLHHIGRLNKLLEGSITCGSDCLREPESAPKGGATKR